MAPALDPVPPAFFAVKATRARPLTGLMPTATGVKEKGNPTVGSPEGKVSRAVTQGVLGGVQCVPARSMTASVEPVVLPLLATRARLRMLSTATERGLVAVRLVQGSARPSVQIVVVAWVAKFIMVMSPEP